jgi:hypothetical protein
MTVDFHDISLDSFAVPHTLHKKKTAFLIPPLLLHICMPNISLLKLLNLHKSDGCGAFLWNEYRQLGHTTPGKLPFNPQKLVL